MVWPSSKFPKGLGMNPLNLRSLIIVCVTLPVLAGLVACGGDGSGGSSTVTATQGASNTGGGGGSAGTGTDEQYLKDLCTAARALADANKTESVSAKSFAELAGKMAGPYENYAKAFAAANPPADLKQWHDTAVTKINAAVAVLSKDKNTKALDGVAEAPYSEFPKPAKGRLAVLAPKMPECNNLTFAGIAGDLR